MSDNGKNNIPVDLIARKLTGEASSEELLLLEKWINESESNRLAYDHYARLWKKTADVELMQEIDVDSEWKKFRKNTGPAKKVSSIYRIAVTLAAAILAGFLLGYPGLLVYRNLAFEKIKAVAEVQQVELPDGSEITLNSGSTIRYPRKFNNKAREVELEGEAFFDVESNPELPFSVKTATVVVKVLGTSFNVDAPGKKKAVSIIVEEGKVGIYDDDGNAFVDKLGKGEKLVVNIASNKLERSFNEDPNFNAYKTGILVFENSDLEEVVKALNKTYNTNIIIETPGIKDRNITVSFNNRDLDYVIKTIEATLDIDFRETQKGITVR
ncbi:MAG TPA: FecR domain-containing protein [Bacteroidales bacterium]|nr:FecR domain-containing protein [Bacteroidales bacterium]